jgi:transcriptional regulator GlxA family with amidase domain
MTYPANRRLMVAQRLLTDSHVPLDRVAAAIGIRLTPAFARAFRRTQDSSPGSYRAR